MARRGERWASGGRAVGERWASGGRRWASGGEAAIDPCAQGLDGTRLRRVEGEQLLHRPAACESSTRQRTSTRRVWAYVKRLCSGLGMCIASSGARTQPLQQEQSKTAQGRLRTAPCCEADTPGPARALPARGPPAYTCSSFRSLGAAARDGRGAIGSAIGSLLDEPAALLEPPLV